MMMQLFDSGFLIRCERHNVEAAVTLSDTIHHLISCQFARSVNVPKYVIVTGYDIDNAPSGIVSDLL